MQRLLWVCLAGALGTGARYLVGLWATERLGAGFPYGTLAVNVVGCFLIGLVMQTAVMVAEFPPALRLALTTGFMGGLTTYSSFAYDTARMAQGGDRAGAVGYFALTTAACFVAVLLGVTLARVAVRPGA